MLSLMARDKLFGPLAKIERAKRHVHEVDLLQRQFLSTEPYDVQVDKTSQPGKILYKAVRVETPPVELVLATGDAIHNLRSALDHLYCVLIEDAGNTIGPNDLFVIRKSAKSFKTQVLPKIRTRVSDDAAEMIRRLKPYQAGNPALWRLHRLDIADKHRSLYVAGSAFESMKLLAPNVPGWEDVEFPDLFLRPADRMFPLKEGEVLFIDANPSNPKDDVQFRFELALREAKVVEGEPIMETLNNLVSATQQTVESFRPLL
jgi:hypothetical protein